jgi:signal transduction histidine kinase
VYSKTSFRQAAAGFENFTDAETGGHRIRILCLPLFAHGRVAAVAENVASLHDVDSALSELARTLLALLPVALILTSLAGAFLTGRAIKPVRNIAKAAETIEATNLDGRLEVEGRDEFATLSRTFNAMLERLDQSFRRLAEAYESQRRFTADASHELKTPLTAIKARVGVALRGTQSPERYAEHLRAIGRSADSMNAIVQDLLLLARSDEGHLPLRPCEVLISAVIDQALLALAAVSRREISVQIEQDLPICLDSDLMARALLNVLGNADRHTPPDGRVSITATCSEPDQLVIEVRDSGTGISPEDLPKVFERFHRADSGRDRESGGTGLGLAIVKSVVEAHGGQVSITSIVGVGTTVTIRVPRSPR